MKNDTPHVSVSTNDIYRTFAIASMPSVRQSIDTLLDSTFNDMVFSIRVGLGMTANPAPLMQAVTDRFWQPWARSVMKWLLAAGVAPYYFVPITSVMQGAKDIPGMEGQRIPVCPLYTEGTITTFRKGGNIGPQEYEWRWLRGHSDTAARVQFIHDSSVSPDVANGFLRSPLASLLEEWAELLHTKQQMLISEDLRTMPPLIMSTQIPVEKAGTGRYTDGITGLDGDDPMVAGQIRDNFYTDMHLANEEQMIALAAAASQVYTQNWAAGQTEASMGGDEKLELWKKRRILLPRYCHLERAPLSDGITRAEFMVLQREFEDHAAAVIGISSGARAPHDRVRTAAGDSYKARLASVIIARRKHQFTSILIQTFAVANWKLFREDLEAAGVSTIRGTGEKRIVSWAASCVDVDLGRIYTGKL